MPGQTKWDQGVWEIIEDLYKRFHPYLEQTDCTLLGDSAFGCFPMVECCKKYGLPSLFRLCGSQTCERWSVQGRRLPTSPVSELVSQPGETFYGSICFWQENQIETNLSECWEQGEEEALRIIFLIALLVANVW
jgi:hypothetical protein